MTAQALPEIALPGACPEFIVSQWCAPPAEETNEARYRELADGGFNLVLTWFHDLGMNRRVLDLCANTGLKALIGDFRLRTPPETAAFVPYVQQLIDDHAGHPGMAGYYLGDEPHAGLFPFFGPVTQYLREHDPDRLPYLNLFPNYAPARILGTDTWDEHLRQYLEIVQPALVSWDHYAILAAGERPEYFANLEAVRRQCRAAGVPYMQVILCTPHGDYPEPNMTDLRWQVFTSLAYGVKGISWFTYWTPGTAHNFGEGLIGRDGQRTARFERVADLNRRMLVLAPTLARLRSAAVWHTDPVPEGAVALPDAGPVRSVGGGPLTIGLLVDDTGSEYIWVVNRSRREAVTAALELAATNVNEISQATGKPVPAPMCGACLSPHLDPGDGRLFRLTA